jgi:hypothetical protein
VGKEVAAGARDFRTTAQRRENEDWGSKKKSKLSQTHSILRSFLFPFSAVFGLILTYVLWTEWVVAAAGAALRPAVM